MPTQPSRARTEEEGTVSRSVVLRAPLLPPGWLRGKQQWGGWRGEMSGFLLLLCGLLVAPTGLRATGNLKPGGLRDGGGQVPRAVIIAVR